MKNQFNRRGFLKVTGAIAALFGAGAASRASSALAAQNPPVKVPRQEMSADDMDKMHEDGVKAFVAGIGKDKDFWIPEMPFKMDGDTKVFEVTCSEGKWQTAPNLDPIDALMYNGRVPGPTIRVKEGDKVRVLVTNKMKQSTAIHFHGVQVPNTMDGVPFITQKPIKPNDPAFTYEFVAKNPGSHMYHSHHNAAEQVTRGLMGAFIIEPKDKAAEPKVAAEYIMLLNDTGVGFSINGRGFPATQPIIAKVGDKIRVRYMNEGLLIHPMHLHGMYQTVISKDGAMLPAPYLADTVLVAPGERYDVIVDCQEPGVWAFHCHVLNHAESSNGMFGMVTALVIQK